MNTTPSNQPSAHTAGPWHVNDTEAHGEACAYAAVIIGAESVGWPCVASLEFYGAIETDSETTKVNARLIAAAPDLLSALREVENLIRMTQGNPHWESILQDAQKVARAAIARAEGRDQHHP